MSEVPIEVPVTRLGPRRAAGSPEAAESRGVADIPGSPEARATDEAMRITLVVEDPDVCEALAAHAEGVARDEYAAAALRIGVLALRQAAGSVDADAVRREGERLLGALSAELGEHGRSVTQRLTDSLREYFDPQGGHFHERVDRLVRRDGELEALLRRQVGDDDSVLVRTLEAHVGADSRLGRLLSPESADGLIETLRARVAESLDQQRERILREFSLDNGDGALARLVRELGERHGEVGRALEERIGEVVAEFSLDDEASALSRLVARVDGAQERIAREFSLDHEEAALARMRRELVDLFEHQGRRTAEFQQEVRTALEAMRVRREETERTTRAGEDFEEQVVRFVERVASGSGDVATHTGASAGVIRHCKKGDAVVELGPESPAPGARFVVEAKQDKSFDLRAALEECAQARKNRGASTALCVASRRTAPDAFEPFARYGPDVVVVWDAEDPASDVVLQAGLSVVRALAARGAATDGEREADLGEMERAVREVERQTRGLEAIDTAAKSAEGAAGKIRDRVRIMRRGLARQVEALDALIEDLREHLDADA